MRPLFAYFTHANNNNLIKDSKQTRVEIEA